MINKKEFWGASLIVILFVAAAYFSNQYADTIKNSIGLEGLQGMFFYVASAAIAVVVAPLTFLPFLAVASSIWGPTITAILSITGWWVGAGAAFLIARRYGYPLVGKIMNLKKVESIQEKMPEESIFWSVVFLHMSLPVDIVSYALGLFTKIRFWPYMAATLIGIAPFAFVFAYLTTVPIGLQLGALVAGIVIATFGYFRIKKKKIVQ